MYIQDKEKKKETDNKWRKNNRERMLKTLREYYQNHKEELAEYAKTHKDKINNRRREFNLEQPYEEWRRKRELNNLAVKRYRANHPDKVRFATERARQWERDNPEKLRERRQLYRAAHKGKMMGYSADLKRKLRKKNIAVLLDYLGVERISCAKCGYNKTFAAIDAHHLKSCQKIGHIDTMNHWLGRSTKFFMEKIKNTDLLYLCKNCHIELTYGLWKIEELYKEESNG